MSMDTIMLDPEAGEGAFRCCVNQPLGKWRCGLQGGCRRDGVPSGGDHAGRQDLEAQPGPSDLLYLVCGAAGGKDAETTPPTKGWIKKMGHIYTTEYYAAMKKNEALPFAGTWVDLEIITPSEVSEKHHMIPLICGLQKSGKKEVMCQTETDSQTEKQTYGHQRREGGRTR